MIEKTAAKEARHSNVFGSLVSYEAAKQHLSQLWVAVRSEVMRRQLVQLTLCPWAVAKFWVQMTQAVRVTHCPWVAEKAWVVTQQHECVRHLSVAESSLVLH